MISNLAHYPLVIALLSLTSFFFFFNDTATTEIYTLSLHDALPICTKVLFEHSPPTQYARTVNACSAFWRSRERCLLRSEEHTSELQSLTNLVCRLLLEKKNSNNLGYYSHYSYQSRSCKHYVVLRAS